MFEADTLNTISNHQQMIDRCFYPDTVEEIMENLRAEKSPYAKQIIERMEANSLLSMKIALKMLRRARSMPYAEVLQMELNVALNKVKDNDF
jgi:enoyl-CoA hydratase